MSRKVTYKLSGKELDAALKFSNDVGMPLNRLAELCFFKQMEIAYRAANEVAKELSSNEHNTPTGDITSNTDSDVSTVSSSSMEVASAGSVDDSSVG